MSFAPCTESDLADAVAALQVRAVECSMADFSSVARGKIVSAGDFAAAQGCKLPTVLLGMSVTGGSPMAVFGSLLPNTYSDMILRPDLQTLARRPGRPHEATVLCEPSGSWFSPAYQREVDASEFSPRAALRRVVSALETHGMAARVAPELEMFLLQRDPASGGVDSARAHPQAHARESACEQYSLERATHFEAYFDELYAACELLNIPVSGHLHEAAFSQFEVNFRPGAPLAQADAVFRFKRLARELAARHGFLASFAAKPFVDQPGTGMHWHFSLQHSDSALAWPHVFATPDGDSTAALSHFIAGLQASLPGAMALLAPYDMAFDRIVMSDSSPTHADWADENRHVAFRVPASDAAARRLENRLPGGDVNPYLAVALTLGLGLAGLHKAQAATPGRDETLRLPRALPAALDALQASQATRACLGDPLVDLFLALKRHEHDERQALADPRQHWDMRHLIELA
jgi:glutamine synthetase